MDQLRHFITPKELGKTGKIKVQKLIDKDQFSNNNIGTTLKSVFAPTQLTPVQKGQIISQTGMTKGIAFVGAKTGKGVAIGAGPGFIAAKKIDAPRPRGEKAVWLNDINGKRYAMAFYDKGVLTQPTGEKVSIREQELKMDAIGQSPRVRKVELGPYSGYEKTYYPKVYQGDWLTK